MGLLCHPWLTTTNLSYRFPIFETSATALCGTYWSDGVWWWIPTSVGYDEFTTSVGFTILVVLNHKNPHLLVSDLFGLSDKSDGFWWFINVYNQISSNSLFYCNCHELGVHDFQTNPDRFWMVKLGHWGVFFCIFFSWTNKRSVPVYKPISSAFCPRWILGWVLFRSHSIERTAYVCEKAGAPLPVKLWGFLQRHSQDCFLRHDDGSKIGAGMDPQSRLSKLSMVIFGVKC